MGAKYIQIIVSETYLALGNMIRIHFEETQSGQIHNDGSEIASNQLKCFETEWFFRELSKDSFHYSIAAWNIVASRFQTTRV